MPGRKQAAPPRLRTCMEQREPDQGRSETGSPPSKLARRNPHDAGERSSESRGSEPSLASAKTQRDLQSADTLRLHAQTSENFFSSLTDEGLRSQIWRLNAEMEAAMEERPTRLNKAARARFGLINFAPPQAQPPLAQRCQNCNARTQDRGFPGVAAC